MPSVALITSRYALTSETDADNDLDLLRDALADAGIDSHLVDWCAPGSQRLRADLVVIKSPWDYASQLPRFLSWLAQVEHENRVLNHPALVRWNVDKRYLADVAAAGVAVCPTAFASDLDQVRSALAAHPGGRVVVKPNVSAASADTGLFDADDPAAVSLAERILAVGKQVMVQPALRSVGEVGERSLVHFGGQLSHTIRKGPLLAHGGGLLTGTTYTETITVAEAPDDEVVLATRALGAVRQIFAARGLPQAGSTLYARVDIARDDDDRPVLLELELFEPSYFLDRAPDGAAAFVSAVVARLGDERAS